jgi:hypothetical protein
MVLQATQGCFQLLSMYSPDLEYFQGSVAIPFKPVKGGERAKLNTFVCFCIVVEEILFGLVVLFNLEEGLL